MNDELERPGSSTRSFLPDKRRRGEVGGRMRRVNEALREVVSQGIAALKDPRIGFVTVTGVRASPDLRQATVYISVLGSQRRREAALAGLESARGLLQARINRELHMKRTPQLVFEYDPAIDRGARLSKLLDELSFETSAGRPADDR